MSQTRGSVLGRSLVAGLAISAMVGVTTPAARAAAQPAGEGSMSFFKSGKGQPQRAKTAGITYIDLTGSFAREAFGFPATAAGSPMLALHERLALVGEMDEVEAVVLRLKDLQLGLTDVEELRPAIERLQASGKEVVVFAEGFGPAEIVLGGLADHAIVQTGGAISLPGMYMEEMFLADTLGWLGVQADLIQVGDYKGANEMMTRATPSPAWDQNINALLDGMYGNLSKHLKESRRLNDREFAEAEREGWSALAPEAVKLKLIDGDADLPVLSDAVAKKLGLDALTYVEAPELEGEDPLAGLNSANPFAAIQQLSTLFEGTGPQQATEPTIAVLHIDGTIVDGDSTSGGLFGGGTSTGSRTVRNAIEDILSQDLIEGVIVRIDSPGGSAIASEVIWQGLRRLAEKKPVWASIGSMAASGGYYCAVGTDKIYVNPSSIVGSIGVVGGKITMGGLYDKLRINTVARSRGPMGNLMSPTAPWSDEQRSLIRGEMTEIYDLFAGRVEQGREGIDLSKTAEGRLFVGSDAVGLKMADEVGGLTQAIDDLAAKLELGDSYDVLEYPEPPTLSDLIDEMMGGMVRGPLSTSPGGTSFALAASLDALRPLMGEAAVRTIADQLNGLMQLQSERVLLISPRAIIIR